LREEAIDDLMFGTNVGVLLVCEIIFGRLECLQMIMAMLTQIVK